MIGLKWVKKRSIRIFASVLSVGIRRKTSLTKVQSKELAVCLIPALYGFNGLKLRRNILFWRILFHVLDWKSFSLTEEKFLNAVGDATYDYDYQEPIGGFFTIDSEQNHMDTPKVQNTGERTYYASGREAFRAIADHISVERKVVLMPYYTCGTVYRAFSEAGWEIVYYRISKNLKIDKQNVESLYEMYRPTAAVFMEHCGMDFTDDELQTIDRLKRSRCITIVDRTQNIYSKAYSKAVDFYAGSLRKWFCCPDGAYLEKNGEIPLPPVPAEDAYNHVFTTLSSAAMFVNGLAQKTKVKKYIALGRFFRQLASAYSSSQPIRARNMSEYSKAVYFQERKKDGVYANRRKENWEYIYCRIAPFTTVRAACMDPKRLTSVPLFFHIYADDADELAAFLTGKGITTWRFLLPKGFEAVDEQTMYLYQHTLLLPCDQRYGEGEMKKLCDMIEAYDIEKQQN